jgi:hypothetical protein
MALFQQTNNALIINCIQSSYLDLLQKSIREAAWARMAVRRAALNPLLWNETVRLAQARMDAVLALAALRATHADPLWPLDAARLRAQLPELGAPARKILSACAEQFDAAARRTSPETLPPKQFLEQVWQERLERATATNTRDRADTILAHGLPLLVHATGRSWRARSDHHICDIDVLLEGPDGRVGISLCNHRDLRGLWRRLKRLPEHLQQRKVEKLVLLRDARLPIRQDAAKVQQYLGDLQAHGARLIRPSAEALAALDALRGLLSDAKAGDLANHGQTVTPQTVQEWIEAHRPVVLGDRLDEILAYPGFATANKAEPGLLDRLMELLDDRPIIALEEAATALGVTPSALEVCARDNAPHLGLLGGPPAVVFRLVEEAPEALNVE